MSRSSKSSAIFAAAWNPCIQYSTNDQHKVPKLLQLSPPSGGDVPRSNPRHWGRRGLVAETAVLPYGFGSRSAASRSQSPTRSPHCAVHRSTVDLVPEGAGRRDRRPIDAVV